MWRCFFYGVDHFVFIHQQSLYFAVLSSVLMWRLKVIKILKTLIIYPLCPYCFSLCILFLLIAICFWRSSISLHAFPMPWILDVFEYPLSICIRIFILCAITSTALIHQDGCVKLHKTLACKNFDLWCHQQESNWSRGHMICFSITVPYDPMDFRAVCQCCNEHKDIELNAWYKKHDKKNKVFLKHSFSATAKSQM